MQGFFSSWAVAATVAILFSTIIGAVLPETSIKKYVTVVLGIIVTLILLSPLFQLFKNADLEQEFDNALNSMKQSSEYEYDSSLYRDYIFKVYMGDE
ncbi:MAG: stage III sporulation protein AF [Christensenellales bacterium]|jgi:stage III sporulation protein AF